MVDKFSTANPQYRDSVFRDFFNDKARLLSLCNALLDTDYKDPNLIEINTLEGNFFSGQKNDISCRIGDNFLVLVEHQTSINPNMAFRCLTYVAQLLNNLVTNKEELYQNELLLFPEPQCFVFYDGEKNEPLTKNIRLSDSFYISRNRLELIVTSFNINFGLEQPLLKKCSYLNDYSTLVGRVKLGIKNKLSRRQAIIQAIDWCIDNNFMKNYLIKKRNEVFSMLDFQWDLDEAKVAWQKQGENKGRTEGIESVALNLLNMGMALDKIHEATKLSIERIKELAKLKMNS